MPVTSEKYKLSFWNVNLVIYLIEEKLLHPSYAVQVIVIRCFATLPALKTNKKKKQRSKCVFQSLGFGTFSSH